MPELTLGQKKLIEEVKVWNTVVDQIRKEKQLPREAILMLKQTPLAMYLLGAKLEYNLYVMSEALKGLLETCQGVSDREIREVPKALTDPLAVIKRNEEEHYTYMLDVFNKNGSILLVDVNFEATKSDGTPVTLVEKIYAAEKDGLPDDKGVIEHFMKSPAYCNREKWQLWAKKHHGLTYEQLGNFVSNADL